MSLPSLSVGVCAPAPACVGAHSDFSPVHRTPQREGQVRLKLELMEIFFMVVMRVLVKKGI